MYHDGPAPTFLRYSINSGSVNFKHKEWFDDPNVYRLRKKVVQLEQQKAVSTLIKDRAKVPESQYNVIQFDELYQVADGTQGQTKEAQTDNKAGFLGSVFGFKKNK